MALPYPSVSSPEVTSALNAFSNAFPVTGAYIKEATIEKVHIVEKTITGSLIVEGTITGKLIAGETITAANIAAGTIEATQIKAATITTELLAAEAVTAAKIKAGTIEATQIKAGAITAEKISVTQLSAITANMGELTAGTITGGTIRSAASGRRVVLDSTGITGYDTAEVVKFRFSSSTGIAQVTGVISTESGSSIDTKYLAGQITETQVTNEAISTPKLAANSVTAAKIVALTITGEKIAASTITAGKLSVTELSSITANIGSITSGTITSATVRSASSFPNVVFNSEGLAMPEGSEEEIVQAKIEWKNSGGTVKEYIAGWNFSSEHNLTLKAEGTKAFPILLLRGHDSEKVKGEVSVQIGGETFTVANGEKESDFLQMQTTARSFVHWGQVSAAGAKVKGSTGWTVEKTAKGKYTIKITTALPTAATFVAGRAGAGFGWVTPVEETTAQVKVENFNGSGALAEEAFNFQLIG